MALLKRLNVNVSDVPNVIAACCTFHNICEIHGDSFDDSLLEGVDTDCDAAGDRSSRSESGVDIRKALMSYFQQHAL